MSASSIMLRQPFLVAILVVNAALALVCPAALAQRHGGGAPGGSGGGLEGYSRPDGVDVKDDLKDFHEVMALQATTQQAAEFLGVLKSTGSAKAALQALATTNLAEAAQRATTVDQVLANARAASNNFQSGFSIEQKSRLRDALRRLAKTDSDLDQEQKRLDQSVAAKSAATEISANADRLDKVLSDFYDQQLALGRKMSIVLSTGQDVTFTLTQVKTPVHFANQTISVPTSGRLSQIAAQSGRRTFRLELMSSLLDLQQNITGIARTQLDRTDRCGERIEVHNASLTPANAVGLLSLRLHYERWMCSRGLGQSTSTELAEGDGIVEIKLTAAVEKSGVMKVAAELGRIDATGMMADTLRNGLLGDDLRNQAAQMFLSTARVGTDFKAVLPPAVQNSASIQSVRFEDAGVGTLSVVLGGQVEISDEQASALASQLNQALSAQKATLQ